MVWQWPWVSASLSLGATTSVAGADTTTATPGVTATTITVGSISDISAPIPGLFEGAKVGTQAYFDYINSQGGVNGRKLVLDARDSAFSSGTVATEAESIAKNDFAFVGGYSLLDNAEQPAIDANKVPMVAQVLSPSLFPDPNVYSAIPLVNGGEHQRPVQVVQVEEPGGHQGGGVSSAPTRPRQPSRPSRSTGT